MRATCRQGALPALRHQCSQTLCARLGSRARARKRQCSTPGCSRSTDRRARTSSWWLSAARTKRAGKQSGNQSAARACTNKRAVESTPAPACSQTHAVRRTAIGVVRRQRGDRAASVVLLPRHPLRAHRRRRAAESALQRQPRTHSHKPTPRQHDFVTLHTLLQAYIALIKGVGAQRNSTRLAAGAAAAVLWTTWKVCMVPWCATEPRVCACARAPAGARCTG